MGMRKASVDLVVVYHNQPDLVQKCIRSIIKNTKWPYRLIVIDNACEEGSDALGELEVGGIEFIHNKENLGFEKAVNQGLHRSTAPYVCFMNDDLLVTKNWLGYLVGHLDRNPDIGAIGPCSNFVMWKQRTALSNDNGDLPLGKIDRAAKENHERHEGQLVDTTLLIGFCFMVRREVLDQVGYLDEQFGLGGSDDLDYSIRITNAGWRLCVAKDVFVYHWGNKTLGKMNEDPDFQFGKLLEEGQVLLKKKWGDDVFEELLFKEDNSLGVALIVKDEAKTLPKCLKHLTKEVDQIVIVDTGSTDNTKEIARQFTDRIYDFEWTDDFSAARNYSLSKLETGWGMWLDADDFLGVEKLNTIRSLIQNANGISAFAFQTHCLDDLGETVLINSRIRLIRLDRSYRFQRRIHEFMDLRGDEEKTEQLSIVHGGPSFIGTKDKDYQLAFNLRILEKEIEERPKDLFVLLNLARALKGVDRLKEAEKNYQKILRLGKRSNNFVYMANIGLAEMYLDRNEYDKAVDYAYQALRCTNLRAEPYSVIGLSYFYQKIFHKAAAAFQTALITKPQLDTFIPIDLGVYNFKSLVNLGSCLFNMGQFEKAEECYEKALGYNPRCEDARRNLLVVKTRKAELLGKVD